MVEGKQWKHDLGFLEVARNTDPNAPLPSNGPLTHVSPSPYILASNSATDSLFFMLVSLIAKNVLYEFKDITFQEIN